MVHSIAQKILTLPWPTIPIIIDEIGALEIVSIYSGLNIAHLEECVSWNIPGVFFYEKNKEEEKKHLSVKDILRFLWDVVEIPYEKRAIYILHEFDEATLEAMNKTLKILEEPPAHAIILLIVTHPESLLETIRSRTLNLFQDTMGSKLNSELENYIHEYNLWNKDNLIRYVYAEKKVDIATAIAILSKIAPHKDSRNIARWEDALISLFTVNETPRNILDSVFLAP